MNKIHRRDFINGSLVIAGSSLIPYKYSNSSVLAAIDQSYYPPALTGLRGSHPGSNEHAHNQALRQKTEWGSTTDLKEQYDLVVVGGGTALLFVQGAYAPMARYPSYVKNMN